LLLRGRRNCFGGVAGVFPPDLKGPCKKDHAPWLFARRLNVGPFGLMFRVREMREDRTQFRGSHY
jgi:hypothetical protein